MRRTTVLAGIIVGLGCLCASGAEKSASAFAEATADKMPRQSWVGYRGPGGYGIFPDAQPPTTFTTNDIAWRVKLPDEGWGFGSPIVVRPSSPGGSDAAGDLVICGVEHNERCAMFPSLVAPRKNMYDKGAVSQTRHLRLLAGGYVYGLKAWGARGKPSNLFMEVHAADGTYVGTGKIPGSSYGCAYTFGGAAIYLRTSTELVCIADYLKGRPQDYPKVVARIRAATSVDELTPFVSHDSPRYRLVALRRMNELKRDRKSALPETLAATRAEDLDPSTRSVIVYALTQSHPKDKAVAACMREQLKAKFKWPPRYKSRLPHPHVLAKGYLDISGTE